MVFYSTKPVEDCSSILQEKKNQKDVPLLVSIPTILFGSCDTNRRISTQPLNAMAEYYCKENKLCPPGNEFRMCLFVESAKLNPILILLFLSATR